MPQSWSWSRPQTLALTRARANANAVSDCLHSSCSALLPLPNAFAFYSSAQLRQRPRGMAGQGVGGRAKGSTCKMLQKFKMYHIPGAPTIHTPAPSPPPAPSCSCHMHNQLQHLRASRHCAPPQLIPILCARFYHAAF